MSGLGKKGLDNDISYAIKNIETYLRSISIANSVSWDTIKEALKRNVPMTPIPLVDDDDNVVGYVCKNCKQRIDGVQFFHDLEDCGQAID